MRLRQIVLCAGVLTGGLVTLSYADPPSKISNRHILTWQAFARDTLALHRKLISEQPVEEKTSTGGYEGLPDFYIEHSYYNARTHKLISQVQWEKANPKQLHTIQLYIYDVQGQLSREFTVAYLPFYHRAPTQTLISFHRYVGNLHAFRTFDASGYRITEGCRGRYQGRDVEILLDENEIADGAPDMQTKVYKLCFAGVQENAGKYLTPQ